MGPSYAEDVCDCFCQAQGDTMLFAKSSDRPATEPQLVVEGARRPPGGTVATQYLVVPDVGATSSVLAQPTWLWGAEHGVNAHGVAIGNEKIFTTTEPDPRRPGLIGMDLVRLGLERSRTADEALEVMVDLLERWGQSGVADAIHAEAYHSSFLIVDARGGWVLETYGASWAARRVRGAQAVSNRVSFRGDWELGSADLLPGSDLDVLRDPNRPTQAADGRLAATTRAVGTAPLDPLSAMAVLRDHGTGPWGADDEAAHPPPEAVGDDGTGVSVCMHAYRDLATTSSMVAQLGDAGVQRLWAAPGAPCVAPFLPAAIVDGIPVVPGILGDLEAWARLSELRVLTEGSPGLLDDLRGAIRPLEAELLASSLELHHELDPWVELCEAASRRAAEVVAGAWRTTR